MTQNIAKFDMQTSIKICDVVKQFFNNVRVLSVQIDNKLKWNAHFRNVQKKNDHTNLDFFTIDRVHVKNLLFKNQIDLHNDYSMNHHLRFHNLRCVAWVFEQRRRRDEEVSQIAIIKFTCDQW